MSPHEVKLSKFLSFVLRHHPEEIGLTLDQAGWTSVAELLAGCRRRGLRLSEHELRAIVAHNDKQRFALSPDRSRIRANQGHSIPVELRHEQLDPPEILYHGTARRALNGIKEKGLLKRQRHHVHLSETVEAATKVGQRHGKPVVLRIKAREMARDGYVFFRTPNKIWLVEQVPPQYVAFPD